MDAVRITHKWNEDPDYEGFAASMLDLLLRLEESGDLQELLDLADEEAADHDGGSEAA